MPEVSAEAVAEAIERILEADLVVVGPGSLYTSVLPNLLISDIRDAVAAANGIRAYVCNVATQVGETEGFDLADHVEPLRLQHARRRDVHVAEDDVGLLVDVDGPWIPKLTRENPKTFWSHIDVDVVKECFPIWGFPSNQRLQGDSGKITAEEYEDMKKKAMLQV